MEAAAPSPAPAKDSQKSRRIVDAAKRVFATAGYHRAQVADVARVAGVAPGTVYLYFSGKDELFVAALLSGIGADVEASFDAEARRRAAGNLDQFLASMIEHSAERPEHQWPARLTGPEPLRTLFEGLYDSIAQSRYAIRILDRSAHDWPHLMELYVTRVRAPAMEKLCRHLRNLQRRGLVRKLLDVETSARFVLETCSWFAMHRLFSPGHSTVDYNLAREATVDHLVASFATPEGKQT